MAVSLLSDAGGEGDLSPKILKFADSASGLAPDDSAISVGVYKPTNYEGSETLPGNAPSPGNGGYSSSLADFNGQTVDNPWKLFVSDDTDNDLIGEIRRVGNLMLKPPRSLMVWVAHLQLMGTKHSNLMADLLRARMASTTWNS